MRKQLLVGLAALACAVPIFLFETHASPLNHDHDKPEHTSEGEDRDLRHRLVLNPVAGLPSRITLKLPPVEKDAVVRALLVLDGKLLTLPLKRDGASSEFIGEFPTPFTSLGYQFQVLGKDDGSSRLSSFYRARASCEDAPQTEEEAFEGQSALIAEAQRLRERAQLLEEVISSINLITGRP